MSASRWQSFYAQQRLQGQRIYDGALEDHLVGTYNRVCQATSDSDTQVASAFYAVYGTEDFSPKIIPPRHAVRDFIGVRSEWLAYIAGRMVYRNYTDPRIVLLDSRFVTLSPRDFEAVMLIRRMAHEERAAPRGVGASHSNRFWHRSVPPVPSSDSCFFLDSFASYKGYENTVDMEIMPLSFETPFYMKVDFSEEECERVRAAAEQSTASPSLVFRGDGGSGLSDRRISENIHIPPSIADTQQKQDQIAQIAARLFNVRGFVPVRHGEQLLRYREGGKFEFHADNTITINHAHTTNTPNRRLVGIMWPNRWVKEVRDPRIEFSGGELVFPHLYGKDGLPVTIYPEPGLMVVFPAGVWYSHGVRPVTAGTRLSLTRWWDLRKAG